MIVFIRILLLVLVFVGMYRILKRMLRGLPNPSISKEPKRATPNPYEVLGITREASHEEIKKAYHQKLSQYHPDKVNHLGDELKRLAQEKTQEITQAYEWLMNKN